MKISIPPLNIRCFLLTVCWIILSNINAHAQCNNWRPVATVITGANCTANGRFSVALTGPDAANLTNIQYGIPLTGSGFSVPLNNSALFTGIPPSTFTVSVVAQCGGTLVGKNTSISMPGSYTIPSATPVMYRASLDCPDALGKLGVNIANGLPPYTITILSAPGSYAGPRSFSTPTAGLVLSNTYSGNYTIQVRDACGNGTVPATVHIDAISLNDFNTSSYLSSPTCDSVMFGPTGYNGLDWLSYGPDSLLTVSMSISGMPGTTTPFVPLSQANFRIKLPAGMTTRNLYNRNILITVKMKCGNQTKTFSTPIGQAHVVGSSVNSCSPTFSGQLQVFGTVCTPLTYTLTNTTTGQLYGPYTALQTSITTPALPAGNYNATVTTGDGYTMTGSTGSQPVPATPYTVSVLSGAPGFQNYIQGFRFSGVNQSGNATIDLVSGPTGYTFRSYWSISNFTHFDATNNMTPFRPNSYYFVPGTYIWRIVDGCGTYYLPVTVGQNDLYQFTAGVIRMRRSCEGTWVWPYATATHNGASVPAAYSIAEHGQRLNYDFTADRWLQYGNGDSILLTWPDHYTIVPSADYNTAYTDNYPPGNPPNPYPNPYSNTYSFDIPGEPLDLDVNHTIGFICAGASAGQAQVYVAGTGGIPIISTTPYRYALAQAGNGVNGPYIQTNTTGIFTGFGGSANGIYDVKITDSCGAFVTQQISILDLATSPVISSTKYVACEGDNVQFNTAYVPNATYFWTGPNGFTSNIRNPLLANIGPAQIGTYYLTINSPACGGQIKDSTRLTMNAAPPKPSMTLFCDTDPNGGGSYLTIDNPLPALNYKWSFGRFVSNLGYRYQSRISDEPYKKYVNGPGSWRAVAVDTASGCMSYSDSLYFRDDPSYGMYAEVTANHLQLCPGDTALLTASGGVSTNLIYQWFYNNAAIPGATQSYYFTSTPGNYKVRIDGGLCAVDTSDNVMVSVLPVPDTVVVPSKRAGCEGEVITLQAGAGPGYIYTWVRNGTTILGADSNRLNVTQTGIYQVAIINGGCARSSDTIGINLYTKPVAALTPANTQFLCNGDSVHFTTPPSNDYHYTWYRNGNPLTAPSVNAYTTAAGGRYTVKVESPLCPTAISTPVQVNNNLSGIDIGKDTVVCQPGPFAISLSVDAAYTQIMWSGSQSSNNIIATKPGLYWVRATNSCGTFTDSIRIHSIDEYLPQLPRNVLICNAENMSTYSVPALLQDIHWSTGATTSSINISVPGNYWVTAQSPCGFVSDTMSMTFCPPVIDEIRLPADTICEGDCVAFSAGIQNYPQQYQWEFTGAVPDSSSSVAPRPICYEQAGIYPVKLRVRNPGGSDSMTTNLVVVTRPVPRFADTTLTISYKHEAQLSACAEAATVNWYKDDSLVCANCKTMTVTGLNYRAAYHCIVSNGGCADSCIYKIQVVDIPHDVWLPDAFTPNGDGLNDFFRIITDNPNVYGAGLMVYNRWGQEIYVSHGRGDGWDGRINGQDADAGIYFWLLRYRVLGTNETFTRKGDIVLVR